MTTTKTTKPADVSVTFHRADTGASVGIDERPDYMRLVYADGVESDLYLSDLDAGIQLACMWHGAKQKLIDAAAISRDPSNGRAASVETKRAAVNEVGARMRAGQWFKPREGSGAGAGGLLFRAVCRFYEGRKTADECKVWLEAMSDAQQQALRRNPKIAAIVDSLRPAAKDGEFDADAALDNFAKPRGDVREDGDDQ